MRARGSRDDHLNGFKRCTRFFKRFKKNQLARYFNRNENRTTIQQVFERIVWPVQNYLSTTLRNHAKGRGGKIVFKKIIPRENRRMRWTKCSYRTLIEFVHSFQNKTNLLFSSICSNDRFNSTAWMRYDYTFFSQKSSYFKKRKILIFSRPQQVMFACFAPTRCRRSGSALSLVSLSSEYVIYSLSDDRFYRSFHDNNGSNAEDARPSRR